MIQPRVQPRAQLPQAPAPAQALRLMVQPMLRFTRVYTTAPGAAPTLGHSR